MSRLLRGLVICVLPVVTGLWVGATSFGGTLLPWRPVMVDLEVYRTAGSTLLRGGDFYSLPGQLQFLYPPFAAVLSVPLAVLPGWLAQVGWTVAGVLAVLAVLHRCGLTGWPLSLIGSAVVPLVEPVSQTLAFGQLGIVLVALVFLDLVPGPRVLPRRLLPEGALTGLAAAIKLTPAIFVAYLVVTRRWRAALVAVLTGLLVTLAGAVVAPQASAEFWGRLAHGDTGLGNSIIYYTNQSVMADVVRIFGLGQPVALAGLALSAVVALAGVWAAMLWHRLGDVRLAVNLCGVAGLLASPVSWLHHFVWVVPLALSLVERRPTFPEPVEGPFPQPVEEPLPEPVEGPLPEPVEGPFPEPVEGPLPEPVEGPFPEPVEGPPPEPVEGPLPEPVEGPPPRLPSGLLVLAWLFVGWVVVAPFRRLPNGADVELTWTGGQNLLASTTALLGVALLTAGIVVARRRHGSGAGAPARS